MRYCTKVHPGRPGTKKLLALYGDRLVCVRYRYDDIARLRRKTVELLISESPWIPPLRHDTIRLVQIRTAPHETRLLDAIARAGGYWDKRLEVWQLPPARARELGLADRIVHRTRPPQHPSASRNFPLPLP